MRRYELMLLFRPDLEDDKLQAAVEKVTRAIVNAGGALTKVSPWGKRRLAYDIQHFRDASYFLLHFDIAPARIRELERGLLISEEVLRHLVTVIEDRGEMSEDELPPAAVPAAERDEQEQGTEAAATAAVADAAAVVDTTESGAEPDAEPASEPGPEAEVGAEPAADQPAEEPRPTEPVEA
jgi:small subunit ribosomal protein S6